MEAARNALERWTNPTQPQEQDPVGVRETSESSSGMGSLCNPIALSGVAILSPARANVRYFSLAFTRIAATRFLREPRAPKSG
jgi:hypothetical protein